MRNRWNFQHWDLILARSFGAIIVTGDILQTGKKILLAVGVVQMIVGPVSALWYRALVSTTCV